MASIVWEISKLPGMKTSTSPWPPERTKSPKASAAWSQTGRLSRYAGRGREFDLDRERAPAGFDYPARLEVLLQRRGVEGRRHHQDLQVGPFGFLQIQRAGQRDVAVKVALVELVEDQGRNAAQLRVLDHLAQQQALGDEADARVGAGDVLEANLVADFAAELGFAFPGDAGRQESRGEPARLEDHHLPGAQQAAIQQHLRDLGGFA